MQKDGLVNTCRRECLGIYHLVGFRRCNGGLLRCQAVNVGGFIATTQAKFATCVNVTKAAARAHSLKLIVGCIKDDDDVWAL